MANTTQSTISAVVTAQIRKTMVENLRAQLVFAAHATKGTIDRGHGTLIFPQYTDLSESATTLADDGSNPTAEAMSLTTFTVTPSEIGRVLSITRRAKAVAPHELVQIAADLLSYDGKRRVDTIVADAAKAGGTVRYSGTVSSRATVVANTTAADIRKAVVKLRSLNAIPFGDGTFKAITDPFVTGDLMAESGGTSGSWVDSARYAKPEEIARGEVGKMFGASFIESTQAPIFAAGGAGSVDVYTIHFLGKGAVGAGSIEDLTPTFVQGADKADALDRTTLIGYRLDQGALALQTGSYVRYETAATAL